MTPRTCARVRPLHLLLFTATVAAAATSSRVDASNAAARAATSSPTTPTLVPRGRAAVHLPNRARSNFIGEENEEEVVSVAADGGVCNDERCGMRTMGRAVVGGRNAVAAAGTAAEKRREYSRPYRSPCAFPRSSLMSVLRGGAAPASQKSKELTGAAYFVLVDVLLRRSFRAAGLSFPSQLAGSVLLFAAMSIVQVIRPGWGDAAFDLMSPGGAWLTRWLPVFFVPGLAMLPLAPSMGGPIEAFKVLGVVFFGFLYTISTTAFTVVGLRAVQGNLKSSEPEIPAAIENVATKVKGGGGVKAAASARPFSEEFLALLVKGTVLSGAISVAASRANNEYASPLQALFMGISTFTFFVWGARLPPALTKIVHPILISTFGVLGLSGLIGSITGSSFENVLRSYKTGTLDLMKTGAGDVLLFMLGPAVVSFGLAMYSRRKLMLENLLVVAAAILVSSAGGLFGTAYFVKLIKLGGEYGRVLRLSVLPRNVTTALAIAIINLVGGDVSIACSAVILTGILGATIGAKTMDALGVTDPIARGLAIGASSQGLGTASIAHETDAFPFAALSMVLTALTATTMATFPVVQEMLRSIVGGAPSVAEAAP